MSTDDFAVAVAVEGLEERVEEEQDEDQDDDREDPERVAQQRAEEPAAAVAAFAVAAAGARGAGHRPGRRRRGSRRHRRRSRPVVVARRRRLPVPRPGLLDRHAAAAPCSRRGWLGSSCGVSRRSPGPGPGCGASAACACGASRLRRDRLREAPVRRSAGRRRTIGLFAGRRAVVRARLFRGRRSAGLLMGASPVGGWDGLFGRRRVPRRRLFAGRRASARPAVRTSAAPVAAAQAFRPVGGPAASGCSDGRRRGAVAAPAASPRRWLPPAASPAALAAAAAAPRGGRGACAFRRPRVVYASPFGFRARCRSLVAGLGGRERRRRHRLGGLVPELLLGGPRPGRRGRLGFGGGGGGAAASFCFRLRRLARALRFAFAPAFLPLDRRRVVRVEERIAAAG